MNMSKQNKDKILPAIKKILKVCQVYGENIQIVLSVLKKNLCQPSLRL